jgi:hypothetical protein
MLILNRYDLALKSEENNIRNCFRINLFIVYIFEISIKNIAYFQKHIFKTVKFSNIRKKH